MKSGEVQKKYPKTTKNQSVQRPKEVAFEIEEIRSRGTNRVASQNIDVLSNDSVTFGKWKRHQ